MPFYLRKISKLSSQTQRSIFSKARREKTQHSNGNYAKMYDKKIKKGEEKQMKKILILFIIICLIWLSTSLATNYTGEEYDYVYGYFMND